MTHTKVYRFVLNKEMKKRKIFQKKPHKCSYCDKTFATPGDLRGHTHIHQGTWPFRCSQCSKGFSKQTNLKNHLLTHTGIDNRSFFL